jgi:hypothetical protein
MRKKNVITKKLKKKANPKSTHYVNNSAFLEHIIQYQIDCRIAENQDKQRPKIPDEIGIAIYDIANKLASKYNFAHIEYKDEMILDGISTAIKAIHKDKFDPKVTQNPFAYFTQVIFWAFLRRINLETKEKYRRYRKIQLRLSEEFYALEEQGVDMGTFMPEDLYEFIDYYENRQKEQKSKLLKSKKKKKKTDKLNLFNLLY